MRVLFQRKRLEDNTRIFHYCFRRREKKEEEAVIQNKDTGTGAKKDVPYRSEIYKRDKRTKFLWRKLKNHVKALSKQAVLLSM
jgi:hypothetical protein